MCVPRLQLLRQGVKPLVLEAFQSFLRAKDRPEKAGSPRLFPAPVPAIVVACSPSGERALVHGHVGTNRNCVDPTAIHGVLFLQDRRGALRGRVALKQPVMDLTRCAENKALARAFQRGGISPDLPFFLISRPSSPRPLPSVVQGCEGAPACFSSFQDSTSVTETASLGRLCCPVGRRVMSVPRPSAAPSSAPSPAPGGDR